MNDDDQHYCPDCWDHRASPAPARCRRPTLHQPVRVVKMTVILEDDQGGKIFVETDNFDWVEMDIHRTDEPQHWLFEQRTTLMNNDHEVIVHAHRVRTYRVYPGDKADPTPILEDPNVMESDGDGR